MSGQSRHDVLRKGARRAGQSSAETNRSGPLRRVVDEIREPVTLHDGFTYEVARLALECGHRVPYPKGPFGADDRIAPERRRCAKCGVPA